MLKETFLFCFTLYLYCGYFHAKTIEPSSSSAIGIGNSTSILDSSDLKGTDQGLEFVSGLKFFLIIFCSIGEMDLIISSIEIFPKTITQILSGL